MDSQTVMILMGGPGTGKSTVVKSVTNIVNETVQNSMPLIRIGTTGTDSFVISGDTCHSVFRLPINSPIHDLKGAKIKLLQYHLDYIILIIIDVILMMGKKILHQIDK